MIIDDQKVLHTEMLIFLGQVLAKNSLEFEIMFPTHSVSIHCESNIIRVIFVANNSIQLLLYSA
jgi:hypothetical protein